MMKPVQHGVVDYVGMNKDMLGLGILEVVENLEEKTMEHDTTSGMHIDVIRGRSN